MGSDIGRPPDSLTMNAVPEGPLATPRRKWAAIAKFHAINTSRMRMGFEPLKDRDFLNWTGISKHDMAIAETQKEYVDVALSIAKGQSVMWFRDELPFMQKAAEKLRASGEDKKYLDTTMALAEMLKFKDFTLEGMEEAEVRDATETLEEILTILKDDAVQAALKNEDGLVPQKVIPALVGASFRKRNKEATLAAAQLGSVTEKHSSKRPDSLMDALSKTGDRAQEPEEIHPLHGSEQDGKE